jgi:hypothetical protein
MTATNFSPSADEATAHHSLLGALVDAVHVWAWAKFGNMYWIPHNIAKQAEVLMAFILIQ